MADRPQEYQSGQAAPHLPQFDALPAGVDDRSPAAARAVLVRFASLLEEGRLSDAREFWTEGSDPTSIREQLARFEQFEANVGEPGPPEGAAGSIFVDIPLRLTGRSKGGEPLDLAGSVTLRRANDVPGSTERQRRWHIFRIELQPLP